MIAPIGWDGSKEPAPQYARARVDLVARDPSLPSQVAVLDPLPACTPAQLRVDSLPPYHLDAAKDAPRLQRNQHLRTTLFTCPGCRGCANSTKTITTNPSYRQHAPTARMNFLCRAPMGRSTSLKASSAHLLAASSGKATGYCTVTPTLELSLNRDAISLVPSGSRGPSPRTSLSLWKCHLEGGIVLD